LGVELDKSGGVRTNAINNELRHQIWHLKERQQQSWLLHPAAVAAGRILSGAGAVLLAGSAGYSFAKGEISDGLSNGVGALGAASFTRNIIMHEIMGYASLRELRASAFSLMNYDFTPITIK
jgi:hypothetical protein